MNILVSACLLGVNCRYDGSGNLHEEIEDMIGRYTLIPVCPEQLGGLGTPRPPAERVGERILTKNGKDVTDHFIRGAHETLELAKLYGCKYAILKERSPSCGCDQIYDGTFTGVLTKGKGMTVELLEGNGILVIGESKIKKIFDNREKEFYTSNKIIKSN